MKKVPVVPVTAPASAERLSGMSFEATVTMDDLAATLRDGLLAMTTAAGLVVMRQMLDAELVSIVGPKHARVPERVGNHHGTTSGQVTLGGRKVSVERPRGRRVDGGEIELDTWSTFTGTDPLQQIIVERMLAGVATRRHVLAAEPIPGIVATGVSKSAVSRTFVAATEQLVDEMLNRDLSDLDVVVLMVDGLNVAGQMIIVALVITADGTKIPVGLRLGDTENMMVVKDLLADLVDRGLRYEQGILAVLDGAKALSRAVAKVFGTVAKIQRCTLHKRRNVTGYLPEKKRKAIDKRLASAFAAAEADKGIAECRRLAAQLKTEHPDAAASLLEGLDEMFTVAGLGITGALRRTLTNTNCIESMISIVRTVTARVKNWHDGDMKKRWIVTGMVEAQRSFRRVRGHRDMPNLIAVLRHSPNPATPTGYSEAA
jgi:putative transposase